MPKIGLSVLLFRGVLHHTRICSPAQYKVITINIDQLINIVFM